MTGPSEAASPSMPGAWGDTLPRRRIVMILASVVLGMLLGALDQTIVGTAMPRVIADLNGMQHYAWVTTAFLLASAASMPIWGKLSDAFGRRGFFVLGMVIFVIGSALCGQSHSMGQLVAYRAVQGLGTGAMIPISQAITGDIFPPAERAKWMGILMSINGFATVLGPLLGGWITDNIGWRWAFYVNLPVGAVAILFGLVALPKHVKTRDHSIDYLGALLLVAAAVPLLLGFSWAGDLYAWSSPLVIGLFAFSVVVWVVFYLREKRVAEPIINPRLFKNSVFTVAVVSSGVQFAILFGATMFLPLFVQGVMGRTATNSGTILMPMMLTHIAVSVGVGWLVAKWGRYKAVIVIGLALLTAGSYLLSRLTMDTSSATLVGFMILMGMGLGFCMATFNVAVQNQFPTYRLGEVTGSLQFFRSLGSTIGLAVFGSILNSRFASSLAASLPAELQSLATEPATAGQINNPQVLLSEGTQTQLGALFQRFGERADGLLASFTEAVRHSLESALSDVFLLMTFLMAVGLVVGLFLKDVPLRRTHAEGLEEVHSSRK